MDSAATTATGEIRTAQGMVGGAVAGATMSPGRTTFPCSGTPAPPTFSFLLIPYPAHAPSLLELPWYLDSAGRRAHAQHRHRQLAASIRVVP